MVVGGFARLRRKGCRCWGLLALKLTLAQLLCGMGGPIVHIPFSYIKVLFDRLHHSISRDHSVNIILNKSNPNNSNAEPKRKQLTLTKKIRIYDTPIDPLHATFNSERFYFGI